MAEKESSTLLLVVGVLVIVLLSAGLTYYVVKTSEGSPAVQPPGKNETSDKPTITVRGEATKTIMPDTMTIVFTIETANDTSSGAQFANSAAMERVKAALLSNGAKESEIQTTYFSTQPQYNESCYSCQYPYYYGGRGAVPMAADSGAAYAAATNGGQAVEGSSGSGVAYTDIAPMPPYPCDQPKDCSIIGYKTTHTIQVKSSRINDGGKMVAAASGAYNSTKVDYVYFSMTDDLRIKTESELQASAAGNAKTKAQNIANGVGAKLGKIVTISTDYYPIYPYYAYSNPEMMNSGMGGAKYEPPPTEIYPTESSMSASIMVEYELEQ